MTLKTKVTAQDVTDAIERFDYQRVEGTGVTICVATLRNGATVVGHNHGPIDSAEFNQQTAEKLSKEMAFQKVWELENYLLRQRHYELTQYAGKYEPFGPVLDSLDLMRAVMTAHERKGEHMTGTSNWAAHIGFAVQDAVLKELNELYKTKPIAVDI